MVPTMTTIPVRRFTVCVGVLTSLSLLVGPPVLAQKTPAEAPSKAPAKALFDTSGPSASQSLRQEEAVFHIKPNLPETVRLYLPDPTEAAEVYQRRAARYTDEELRNEFKQVAELALDHIRESSSPSQIRLSVQEAIRRAAAAQLRHSRARLQPVHPGLSSWSRPRPASTPRFFSTTKTN